MPRVVLQPACGAVVGVGFFAENHLHAWKELEVPIAAICDIDEERLNEVGEQFGIPAENRFTDIEDLLEAKEALGLNFVDIATQVNLCALCRRARGRMALRTRGALALGEAARVHGTRLAEHTQGARAGHAPRPLR